MKNSIKFLLFVIIISGSLTGYMLYTEKMMIRLPMLVQKNPRITFVTGDVHFKAPGNDKWEIALVGKTLGREYEVKTGKDSLADLRFTDKMAIRITENSLLKLSALTVKKLQLDVKKGSMYGKFEKIFKNYKINIKTPTSVASVRGTELGFEVIRAKIEEVDKKDTENKTDKNKEKTTEDEREKNPEEITEQFETTIYSLSGITELQNPKHKDKKVILSYQNKLRIKENDPPDDIEKLTDDELSRLRSILNSIHTEEVLLISDKIGFKVGSSKILKSSFKELDKILELLRNRNVKIRIQGHTDDKGNDSYNQELSEKRSKAIAEYFTSKGIPEENLETAGFGESRPIADNKTKKGRALNRRVEFIIVDE